MITVKQHRQEIDKISLLSRQKLAREVEPLPVDVEEVLQHAFNRVVSTGEYGFFHTLSWTPGYKYNKPYSSGS